MENPPHSPGDTFQPSNNESVTPTSLDPQASPKRKSKKSLIVVILLLSIIIGLLIWKLLIPNLQFRASTSKANQFVNSIAAGDAQAAYSQTSLNYQDRVSQEQLQQILNSDVVKSIDKSSLKLVSKKSVSPNPPTIEYKYAFNTSNKTYHIKLTLVEKDGSWQVDDAVLSADTDGFQREGVAN